MLQLVLTGVYFALQGLMALFLYLILRAITSLLERLVSAITEIAVQSQKSSDALLHATEALAHVTGVNERLSILLAEKELGKPPVV